MTEYKRLKAKNGRVMYFINGDMVSPKRIPADVLSLLGNNTKLELDILPLDIVEMPKEAVEDPKQSETVSSDRKVCIFTGEPATHEKFLQGVTIGLSDESYRAKTTGQIVAQMKIKNLI